MEETKKLSVLEFKTLLEEPGNKISALNAFIRAAQAFNDNIEDGDIVSEYLHSSERCFEVLELLDSVQRKENAMVTNIFKVLKEILVRIAGDLTEFMATGLTIVNYLLPNHVGLFYTNLNPDVKPKFIKPTLQLLACIVALGRYAAKNVLKHLNFNNILSWKLLNIVDIKDPLDVRTSLIHFVIAFLIVDDNDCIRQIIAKKGLVSNIFANLQFDRSETIQIFLSTFIDKVIKNLSLPKTLKVKLFTENAIKGLTALYYWKGPLPWKERRKQVSKAQNFDEDEASEELTEIRNLCCQFLKEICCSIKYGIAFHDYQVGISGKNNNFLITKVLKSLEKPYLSNQLQELVIDIIVVCPDQIIFYLPSLSGLLSPRESSLWLKVISFIQRIFEELQYSTIIYQMDHNLTLQDRIAILSNLCIPSILPHSFFSDALQHDSLVVRHKSLQFLQKICKWVKRLFHWIQLQSSFTKIVKQQVIQSIQKSFLEILPLPHHMLNCWQKGLRLDLSNSVQSEMKGFPDIRKHLTTILDSYEVFHIIPSSGFIDIHLDYFKMLSELNQQYHELEIDLVAELRLKVLSLLSQAETSQMFIVLKVDDTTVLDLLINIVLSSDNIAVKTAAKDILIKSLLQTGWFPGAEEVLVWVNLLLNCLPKHKKVCTQFFGQIIENVCSNQQLHFDSITKCVMESFESSLSVNHDSSGTMDGLYQELMSNDSPTSKSEVNLFASSYPFSPLVNAAPEVLHEERNIKATGIKRKLLEYMLMGTCHLQKNPRPFLYFLKKHKHLLSESFLSYMKYIDPELFSEEQMNPVIRAYEQSELSFLLQKVFMDLEKMTSEDIETYLSEYLSPSTSSEINQVSNQLLFYICILLERQDSENFLECFLQILMFLLKYQLENKNLPRDVTESEFGVQILKHPLMSEWFLKDDSKNSSNITSFLIQVMELFESNNEISICKRLYCAKMVDVLSRKLSSLQNQSSYFMLRRQWMEPFISLFSSVDCQRLCISLTSIPVDVILKSSSTDIQWVLGNILRILTEFIEKKPQSLLNIECFQLIIMLWRKSCQKIPQGNSFSCDLETIILKLLLTCPVYSSVCSSDFLLICLNNLSEIRSKIVSILLIHNIFLKQFFEEFCLKKFHSMKNLLSYLPIIKDYMMSFVVINSKEENNENLYNMDVILLFYQCFWSYFIEEFVENHDSHCNESNFSDFCIIIKNFISLKIPGKKDMKKLWKCIFNGDSIRILLHKEGLNLTKSLHCHYKDCQNSNKQQKLTTQFLEACLKLVTLVNSKHYSYLCPQEDVCNVVNYCNSLLQKDCSNTNFLEVTDEEIKMSFVKRALKIGLQDENQLNLLDVVNGLCCYETSNTSEQILEMIISHSAFVPIMLGTNKEFELKKDKILNILLTLCEKVPSACKSSHIPLLLGAYGGTLKKTDRKLHQLIVLYEENSVDMQQFRPFFWGPSAVTYYSERQNFGPSRLNQSGFTEVLALLDYDTLHRSIQTIPLNLSSKQVELMSMQSLTFPDEDLYDPRFLLPLFSQLLKPEVVVHCQKFIESGALGFLFAVLSSKDDDLRAAGYHNLAQFYEHLQGSSFSQRNIWIHILDSLRNSLQNPNTQLSNIISQFLAKASFILLNPGHLLYKFMSSFLLLKPALDLWNVPEFFRLFNSTEPQHHKYRLWFLSFLQESLRLPVDYFICEKRHVFKLLLSFGDSYLCDYNTKVKILDVLHSAIQIAQVALQLIKHHSFLCYLHGLIIKNCNDDFIITKVINILEDVWLHVLNSNLDLNKSNSATSVLMEQQNSVHSMNEMENTDVGFGLENKVPLLPVIFISDCFLTMKALLSCLKSRPSISLQYWKKTVALLALILEQFNRTRAHMNNHNLPEALPQLSSSELLNVLLLHKTFLQQESTKDDKEVMTSTSETPKPKNLEEYLEPQGLGEAEDSSVTVLLVQWLLMKLEIPLKLRMEMKASVETSVASKIDSKENNLWINCDQTFLAILNSLEFLCKNVQLTTDCLLLVKQILVFIKFFIKNFGEKLFLRYSIDSPEVETLVNFIVEGYNRIFTFQTMTEHQTELLFQLNDVFVLLIQHFKMETMSKKKDDMNFSTAVQIQKTLKKPTYHKVLDSVVTLHSNSETTLGKRPSCLAVAAFINDCVLSNPSPEIYQQFCCSIKSVKSNKRKSTQDAPIKKRKKIT